MSVALSTINIYADVRIRNNNGTDETLDIIIDGAKKADATISNGFGEMFFFSLPNGVMTGGGSGGFKAKFISQKWNTNAFEHDNTVETPVALLDKYETEDAYIYEVILEKNFNGTPDFSSLTNIGHYTDIEIWFVPSTGGSGVKVFSTTGLRTSTFSSLIQTGQTLKGIFVENGDGVNDTALFQVKFKIEIKK